MLAEKPFTGIRFMSWLRLLQRYRQVKLLTACSGARFIEKFTQAIPLKNELYTHYYFACKHAIGIRFK